MRNVARLVIVATAVMVVRIDRPSVGGEPAEPAPFPEAVTLRVETDLFAGDSPEPVATSLTLFDSGVAWDFLEVRGGTAADSSDESLELVEIVLQDPARERVVVIDPGRSVKTEIPLIRLERLSVSLANWARSSDDRLVRWAGGPDFSDGFSEEEGRIELAGPRVRYAVALVEADSSAASSYRRFADTAILLRALLQPGGIPPFPRLALNRRLETIGGIPGEVTLDIDSRNPLMPGSDRLRSVHKSHPQLIASDHQRIEEARARMASVDAIDLAAYMAASATAAAADAGDPADDGPSE